ncbi:hypothetical protein IQ13_4185 [Lacibacter cauensis]|uniref:Uncharacterized protein n=1 Tax=Lacibacter cauensis TaxID=510947 RepID=A0A562S9V1_9BACT|nr:hypothetical protein [Lacibacter cauensis]TWI77943.1 hypothetical protein IQ13_4185 [Lacibacter cauensis]
MGTNTQDDLKENNTSFAITAFVTGIVIVGLWAATILFLKDWDDAKKSAFGDMFGSINALFSGLALAGIILTILLQRKELSLQRKELRDTREELKRTATAQENSEKALKKQAENLKISAQLSALNTLVSFYTDLEINVRKGFSSPIGLNDITSKKNAYVSRIEEILEHKEELI